MTHAQRMAEIKAREAAATGGPWYSGDDPGRSCPGCDEIEYYFAIVGTGSGGIPAVATIEYDDRQSGNRDFIAQSRADIPYLLSRVEMLEAALREAIMVMPDSLPNWSIAEHNELLNRLTAALEGSEDA